MKIQFIRTGFVDYVSRAFRDDGCVVQVPGYGGRFKPPHDYGHYLVERVYAPAHGLWGIIAAGAIWGDMQLLVGRRPPHSAERSKIIMRMADEAHTSCEQLVCAFQRITDEKLDNDWRASKAVFDEYLDYRTTSRPKTLEEVQRVCADFRDAAQQWSQVPVSGAVTVSWKTAVSGRDRRFALPKKHARAR